MTDLPSSLPAATHPATSDTLQPIRQIKNALKTAPLLVNGYAMIASTGLTSLIGLVFWMAATHLYDQEQVGLGAALIAAMSAISYFGQLNLSTVLNRFLPTAGQQAAPLIFKAYLAAGLLSGTLALCFALTIGTFSAPLRILTDDPVMTAIFVFATVIWTVFALQDAALSGLRLSVIIPFENTVYAILKIAFLVGFAFLMTTPANGIYLGWTLALVPVVFVVNVLIFRHLALRKAAGTADPVDLKAVYGFLTWDYAGSIFLTAAFGLAPLMISSIAGVEANAPYHVAWTFAYSVYLIGRSMSISLLAESAAFPERIARLTADTFCHTMLMVAGAVTTLWIAAPYLLELFGAVYVAQSTSILRVLVLACLPWAATTTVVAALRARGQTRSVAALQLATLIIFTAASAWLLHRTGALGVAFGWLIAHSLVLTGYLVFYLTRPHSVSAKDLALLLATSLANIARNIVRRFSNSAKATQGKLPDLKKSIGRFDPENHQVLRTPKSASDCTTLLLTGKSGALASNEKTDLVTAVVKYAVTPSGIAALQRNARVLKDLHSDHRIRDFTNWFPKILGEERSASEFTTVETGIPGEDGRTYFSNPSDCSAAIESTVSIVSGLHESTAQPSRLGQSWAAQWIDEPIEIVAAATRNYWGSENRAAALECVREDLRRLLLGRKMPLGWCHGDLSPGNILLERTQGNSGAVKFSGLIDWDNSRRDAPLALDLYHLALTTRMQMRDEELGLVVRTCIDANCFSLEDITGFNQAVFRIPSAISKDEDLGRAMLLLAWLHHVSSNLIKSERYMRNWLWTRSNVDRVLDAITAQTG
ncbi:MAG: phosphotransferase [Roseibium sp.]|uniref:phosphotransferase n=1 Tax=Roseibium sp. TaxID=1936156 RepID=UPI0026384B6E|nr:phosphotransferase [Roseibium sp.]MCV0426182.1 phosphotransferase [Roseibium sp.]